MAPAIPTGDASRPSTSHSGRPGTAGRPGTSSGKPRSRSENLTNIANRLRTPMYISDKAMPPEQETIQAIEGLLQIPTLNDMSEEAIVEQFTGDDGLVTDPDFMPDASSLYPDPAQPPATAVPNISWARVSGTLYMPRGCMPKLLPGVMDDHNFLGALAAVACKQDLLLELIVSNDHAEQGVYTFQIYKHGCWHQVVVDNFLPCVDREDRLAFACSGNVGELWPSFLEKAYAKIHGSYFALEGMSAQDAMVDLTGGTALKVDLSQQEAAQAATSGVLWAQLCSWISAGCIITCKSKQRTVVEEAGTSGLLYNHLYSIIDARQVDEDTRLLRIHCPWPGGLWHGPWSAGSKEWLSPSVQQLMGLFAATLQDDSTSWIEYNDFINFFNRLYICRLFPPSWHQLTLHCGWQGPSAGGPCFTQIVMTEDGEPHFMPSSTWCCNPQFRITVRKACEVVVCLGQQDPMVLNRTHIRKAQRTRHIGMQVLRVPLSVLGRRWEVRSYELLQELPLSASRELSVTFRAEPEFAYVVVPYSGRAGEEGAFVLRTFSSSPLEVEQLPSPLSLVLGGHWVRFLAGGNRHHASFGSNPQYMISTQHRTQVVVSVSRLDNKFAILKPTFSTDHCVGLYLLEPEKGPEGLGRRSAVRNEGEVHAEAGFSNMEEAVLMFMLEPETPYVLVPCLTSPSIEAPFELRIMSAVPVELVPLPEVKSLVHIGQWAEDNSGGCDLNPVWKKNPRYLLALSRPSRCRIVLTRLGKFKKSSVDDMIGFYVLRASDVNGDIKGDLRRAVLHETTFVTTGENCAEYDLQGAVPYVIIPCTYGPGRYARYTLSITCNDDFDLVELR